MESKRKTPELTFYRSFHFTDKFNPGEHIALERSVEFNSFNVDQSNLAELVTLPLKELQTRHKDKVAEEKTAFEKVQTAAEEWVTQAAQTMLLDRAVEYVRTPEVKHTSNIWAAQKDGVWEISNRVYKMRYTIKEQTAGSKKGQWLVTWGIAINRPPRPSSEKHYYNGDIMVVEQKKKYYNAEADAQHYIQGRYMQYAHLFTEISPPIPDKYKRHFHINGVLLPGYTVAPPERPPQEVADELLSLLDDNDIAPPPSIEPETPAAQEEPPKAADEKTSPDTQTQKAAQALPVPKAEKPDKRPTPPKRSPARQKPKKNGHKKRRAAPER